MVGPPHLIRIGEGLMALLLYRELSSKITQEERNVACDRLEVYRKWFMEHVMQEGRMDTVVLIPIENISPRYRDDPPL